MASLPTTAIVSPKPSIRIVIEVMKRSPNFSRLYSATQTAAIPMPVPIHILLTPTL